MATKAVFQYQGDPARGLTKGRYYAAFPLLGSLMTVNDEGELIGIGYSSYAWRLSLLIVDDEQIYKAEGIKDGEEIFTGRQRPQGRDTGAEETGGAEQAAKEGGEGLAG